MARVIVKRPVDDTSVVGGAGRLPTVVGEGLDSLDPTVTLTPAVKQAFLCLADSVLFQHENNTLLFAKTNDYCHVTLVDRRIMAVRYVIYEPR